MEAVHRAGDVALPAEEAGAVGLLERVEAGERAAAAADLERLLAGQERRERGAELRRGRDALGLALLEAAIDDPAERAQIGADRGHAGHGLVEARDEGEVEHGKRRERVDAGDEL